MMPPSTDDTGDAASAAERARAAFRYVVIVLSIALGAMLPIAGFCWAMDAYRVYDAPIVEGVNDVKGGRNSRMVSAYALRERPVGTLLLGNSRMRAFDEAHPVLARDEVLIVTLAGTSIWEIDQFFQHALTVAPIRRALVLTDFVNFNATGPSHLVRPAYLTHADDRGDAWRRVTALAPPLVSVDGLTAAFETLRGSWAGAQSSEPGGRYGTRRLFRAAERGFARAGGALTPGVTSTFQFDDPRSGETSFDALARILAAAHARGVELHLVISPSHARMWQIVDSLGLWETWEDWKRGLVAANESAARRAGAAPLPLWDFSGFSTITTEEVPPHGGEPMRYYEEVSHYTRPVGDLVLARTLGGAAPDARFPDFGVRLEPGMLEAHLAAIRAARDAWQETHPEDVRDVEAQLF